MSPVRLGPVTSTNDGGSASRPDPRRAQHVGAGGRRESSRHDTQVDRGQQRGRAPAGHPAVEHDRAGGGDGRHRAGDAQARPAAAALDGGVVHVTPRAARRRADRPRPPARAEVTTDRPPSSATRSVEQGVGRRVGRVDDVAGAVGVARRAAANVADQVVGVEGAVAGQGDGVARRRGGRRRVHRVDRRCRRPAAAGPARGSAARSPRLARRSRARPSPVARLAGRSQPARHRSRKRSAAGRGHRAARAPSRGPRAGARPASAAQRPHVAARVVARVARGRRTRPPPTPARPPARPARRRSALARRSDSSRSCSGISPGRRPCRRRTASRRRPPRRPRAGRRPAAA